MDSREDIHKEAEKLRADGLTWSEIADTLEVSRSTVWRWRKAGKVREPGSSNGAGTVQHRSTDAGDVATDGETPTLSSSRARKEDALARKHELDAAEREADLITRDAFRDSLAHVRRVVDSLPRRKATEVAEMLGVTPREAMPLLEDVADAIIAEIHDQLVVYLKERHEEANSGEEWKQDAE